MKPVLITERDLIRQHIEHSIGWLVRNQHMGDSDVIARAKRVAALNPETATLDEVAAADGGTYPSVHCDGCDNYVTRAVRVGDEPDYESNTATLCTACAFEAFSLLKAD